MQLHPPGYGLYLSGDPDLSATIRKLSTGFTCSSDRATTEHATIIGELVDHLDLDGFLIMIQDWGGPIGLDIATKRADRVRGVDHGNTWFWPVDTLMFKIFPRVMSTRYMQRRIFEKNFFVERIMPRSMVHPLSQAEMDHHRGPLPTPEARAGVAGVSAQILKAESLLARLKEDVPRLLGAK